MAEAGPGSAGGYVAFISYSHKDSAMGRWLHRKLEGYRLPKRLAGTQGEDGEVPARLTPIFRDRDELPAAGDLSERVRAALAVSRNLIVLCSPNSAKSPWVAKEIATFRELHPGRPIFTAIVEGEPGQCFSPALLEGGVEPLAADLRKEGDGRRLGLLKLVAGLAGVGLDALVQRDAARRVRRVTYVTAAAVTAMLVMALLTAFTINARAEAQRQREEAEGLVEFMLTDLRDRLKGVGRLDVLTAVNRRALAHYGSQQKLNQLPAAALERRSRILHAMGEDELAREDLPAALSAFLEARRTTASLLERRPDDPDRIFTHSQNEFWIGHVAYERKNYAGAKAAFERYRALADRLTAINRRKPEWLKEAAYAEGSLCTVVLEGQQDIPTALRRCRSALERMEEAARASGNAAHYRSDLANRHAYVADALRAAGNAREALHHRKQQLAYVERQLAEDRENARLRAKRVWAVRGIANLEAKLGDRQSAAARLAIAIAELQQLTRLDPDHADWVRELELMQGEFESMKGDQG